MKERRVIEEISFKEIKNKSQFFQQPILDEKTPLSARKTEKHEKVDLDGSKEVNNNFKEGAFQVIKEGLDKLKETPLSIQFEGDLSFILIAEPHMRLCTFRHHTKF